MNKLIWISFGTVFFFSIGVTGQTPSSTPDRIEIQREQERQRLEREKILQDRGRQISDLTKRNLPAARKTDPNAAKKIRALYRRSTKKELQLMAPDKADMDRFAEFLKQPMTGLILLVPDKGCSENMDVVVAAGDCLVYTMPGAGHSYSFRVHDYRMPRLADISLTDHNSFESRGILEHGIFADLGDIPLEQVDIQTKGLKFLVDFQPEPDIKKALAIETSLAAGVANNGYMYARELIATENTTYALRSIAYRGKYSRTVGGVVFDAMEMDRRKDVLVAFRIVRRRDDGAVTILWKILTEQDSPRSNWGDDKKDTKADPSKFTAKEIDRWG